MYIRDVLKHKKTSRKGKCDVEQESAPQQMPVYRRKGDGMHAQKGRTGFHS